MLIQSFLEKSADRVPEKTALVCGNRRLTFAELETLANRLANDLIHRGIRRGDRVGVLMANSTEAVVSIFAILKAGGVLVVIHPSTKSNALAYQLNDCKASGMLCDAASWGSLAPVLPLLPSVHTVWTSGICRGGPPAAALSAGRVRLEEILDGTGNAARPDVSSIDIDLAALIYTSGSTGVPKGAMFTHANVEAATSSITTYLENSADDIILNVLPLSFSYGMDQVFMTCRMGATLVLERSFAYPHSVLTTLARERVTGFPMVPAICAIMLQLNLETYDFSSLRYLTSAAAPLPGNHISRLRHLMPSVRIYSMYGLTECKRVSYLPPDQIDTRPSSVGKGMPNQEAYVVDDEGKRVGPGVVGELVVRGSHVMQGYWNAPEETAKRLRPGPLPWQRLLYTGDLFKTDEEGYLYFVSRRDDIIKTGGHKVSPAEVEEELYALDGIAEAAVVGVADSVLGSSIKAIVSLRAGASLTANEILHHCAGRLSSYRVPSRIEIRDSLPKTSSGKINRRALGEQWSEVS